MFGLAFFCFYSMKKLILCILDLHFVHNFDICEMASSFDYCRSPWFR